MRLFLKLIVTITVFFTPFSFAATEPWAFSILQGLVLLGCVAVIASRQQIIYPSLFKPVVGVFGVLIGLAAAQCFFPQTLLDAIPNYPITLMRLYTLEHLSLFITYFALTLLIVQVYASLDEVKQLVWTLIVSAGAVAICDLLFPGGQYITFLTGVKASMDSVGPFLNRNHAGMFLAMNALLSVGLFFTHQLQYYKIITREQRRNLTVQQVCLALLSLGLIVAAVYSRSRGAMLSLLVGLFSYSFLCFWAVPGKIRKQVKGFFYTLLLLMASVGWIYTHLEEIGEFAHRTTATSSDIRKMLYRSAGHILEKYPVWGIGVGAMPVVINEFTEYDVHQYIERLHNDWLEIVLGIGYAGTTMLLVPLMWFVALALRRLKHLELRKQFMFAAFLSVLLAMGVGSLVDFHFFIPGCAVVFFMVLGLCNAATFHSEHVHRFHHVFPFILLILALMAAGYIPLQKTRCWRLDVFGSGLKTEPKLAAYETALTYYPGPRQATRLASAYYVAAKHSQDPIVKLYYFERALEIAQTYLEMYPKDKELSRIYVQAKRKLG